MKYKNFEDYLNWKFFQENPQVLDDQSVEAFEDWLQDDLGIDGLIAYADKYAKEIQMEVLK